MTYIFKLPLKLLIFFSLGAGSIVWIAVVLILTVFKADGGPISDDLKLYLYLPSFLTGFLIVRYYDFKYRYKITLDGNMFHMIYDKRRKKNDIHINARDIRVFEIVYLENEQDDNCYRIYSNSQEVTTFERSVVPLDRVLDFCQQNGIEPLTFTISLNVFFVALKRKHVVIQYYCRKKKDKKLETTNIRKIELEILHPISDSHNRYIIYTLTNEQYEFEYHAVNSSKLAAYAVKHNFPLTEKKMY